MTCLSSTFIMRRHSDNTPSFITGCRPESQSHLLKSRQNDPGTLHSGSQDFTSEGRVTSGQPPDYIIFVVFAIQCETFVITYTITLQILIKRH